MFPLKSYKYVHPPVLSPHVSGLTRLFSSCFSRERDYDDIDEEDPFNPRVRRIAAQNPNLTNMHSFCSYSSSMGSQTSLHPPAPAVSNAPMSEYM